MKELFRSILVFTVMSLATGLLYPLAVTGIAKAVFPYQAGGSLLKRGEQTVGSAMVGQQFSSARYFHGRPSALEKPYDAGNSGGSNLGPASKKFLDEVERRVEHVRKECGLHPGQPVPADLVLASASGLDPHVSPEGATVQVKTVAKARGLPERDVSEMVERLTEMPFLGFLGEKRVHLLKLNLALDELSKRHGSQPGE